MSEYVPKGSEKWVTARLAPLAKGNYPLAKEAQKDMMEALAIALSQMPREMQVEFAVQLYGLFLSDSLAVDLTEFVAHLAHGGRTWHKAMTTLAALVDKLKALLAEFEAEDRAANPLLKLSTKRPAALQTLGELPHYDDWAANAEITEE